MENKLTDKIAKYFHDLRFDDNHHLGVGDIRITLAQQVEIIDMIYNHTSKVVDEITIIQNDLHFKILGISHYMDKLKGEIK